MKVVVIVEGGIVQHILVDNEKIEVRVIDYDTDGAPIEDITTTHNGDEAYIYKGLFVGVDAENVCKYFEL